MNYLCAATHVLSTNHHVAVVQLNINMGILKKKGDQKWKTVGTNHTRSSQRKGRAVPVMWLTISRTPLRLPPPSRGILHDDNNNKHWHHKAARCYRAAKKQCASNKTCLDMWSRVTSLSRLSAPPGGASPITSQKSTTISCPSGAWKTCHCQQTVSRNVICRDLKLTNFTDANWGWFSQPTYNLPFFLLATPLSLHKHRWRTPLTIPRHHTSGTARNKMCSQPWLFMAWKKSRGWGQTFKCLEGQTKEVFSPVYRSLRTAETQCRLAAQQTWDSFLKYVTKTSMKSTKQLLFWGERFWVPNSFSSIRLGTSAVADVTTQCFSDKHMLTARFHMFFFLSFNSMVVKPTCAAGNSQNQNLLQISWSVGKVLDNLLQKEIRGRSDLLANKRHTLSADSVRPSKNADSLVAFFNRFTDLYLE